MTHFTSIKLFYFYKLSRVAFAGLLLSLWITGCGGGSASRSAPERSTTQEAPRPTKQSSRPTKETPPQGVTDSGPVIGATQPKPASAPPPPPPPPPTKVQKAPEPRRTPRTPVRQSRPAPGNNEDDPFGVLLGKRPQITAQESSSGSSIRGLSPLAKDYANRSGYPKDAVNAVKQMEQFQVDRKTLYQFQREGGLRSR